MFIFSRTATSHPARVPDATAFAAEVAHHVTQVTGRDLAVYQAMFGMPAGTFLWSMRVESHTDLEEVTAKLTSDARYLELITQDRDLFVGTIEDRLLRIIAGNLVEPKPIYTIMQAAPLTGHYGASMAFGVEIQQYVAELTGTVGAFGSGAYGEFGIVSWLGGFDTMAQLDEANDKLMGDEGYLARVEEGSTHFQPGSGQRGLIRQLQV